MYISTMVAQVGSRDEGLIAFVTLMLFYPIAISDSVSGYIGQFQEELTVSHNGIAYCFVGRTTSRSLREDTCGS